LEVLVGAGQIELVPVVRPPQGLDNFSSKDPTEDLHGQEEARVRRVDPPRLIGRESPGWHDAVHVRVTDQGLSPRMEDAQHANLGPEVARVGGDLAEGRCARLEEPRVQTRAVPIGQRQEGVREGEDEVHIRHVEQLPLARLKPPLPERERAF
jgi:hypothetical protein